MHLRYQGTEAALPVELTDAAAATAAFTAAHRARFGFATPERPLTVEAVVVEASAAGEPVGSAVASPAPTPDSAAARIKTMSGFDICARRHCHFSRRW